MDKLLSNYFDNCTNNFKLLNKDIPMAKLLMQKCLMRQNKAIMDVIKQNKRNVVHENRENILSNDKKKICLARIHTGGQCSRKCKDNSDYCGGHIHSLPYGSINDPQQTSEVLTEKKSRGRKSKSKENNVDIDLIDLTKYVPTHICVVNDKNYLIDENGVLFSNNDSNTIVGRKNIDGIYTWF